MITDDKVLEIEHYCQEHNVSRISRLKELGIPKGQFYRGKMRLQLSCTSRESGNFLQIGSNGEFIDSAQVFKTIPKEQQCAFRDQ